MNVFEFFTKIIHLEKKAGWVETTAYFTGERRLYHKGRGRGMYNNSLDCMGESIELYISRLGK